MCVCRVCVWWCRLILVGFGWLFGWLVLLVLVRVVCMCCFSVSLG